MRKIISFLSLTLTVSLLTTTAFFLIVLKPKGSFPDDLETEGNIYAMYLILTFILSVGAGLAGSLILLWKLPGWKDEKNTWKKIGGSIGFVFLTIGIFLLYQFFLIDKFLAS